MFCCLLLTLVPVFMLIKVSLKLLCDNNTSCKYENKGSLVESCEEPYYADYLEIYYECSQSEGKN